MIKSFKYCLYPTRKQREALQFTLDRNRELYNAALQERRDAWRMSKVSITYSMQSAQLSEIKEIRPEYNEIYSQVLQDTLKRVDKAFKNFFQRVKQGEKAGYPVFRDMIAMTHSPTHRLRSSRAIQRFASKMEGSFLPRSGRSKSSNTDRWRGR